MAEATQQVPAADNTAQAGEQEALLNPQQTPEQGEGAAPEPAKADTVQAPAPEVKEGDEPLLNPDGEEDKASEGAPEKYEFKLPEGWQLEGEELEKVSGLFKGMNLSQGGAQKLVDYFTERMAADRATEEQASSERRKAWREEVRQRPNFAAERALAQKGLRAVITDPDEKALFTNSWLSDHPAFFKVFSKIGRLVGEDSFPAGGSNAPMVENINLRRFPVE